MNPAIFNQPFIQITPPILLGMFLTAWATITTQNKRFVDFKSDVNRRFDDVYRRFDEVFRRFDKIDLKLENHGDRSAGSRNAHPW